MKSKIAIKTLVILAIFWASKSFSTPFPSPDAGVFGPDIDGDGYFSQGGGLTISLELFDVAGFDFGFFFEGDPGTLVQIFDPLDQNPDPGGPGSVDPIALVQFVEGFVFDIDDNVVQSLFTGSTADFGFYASFGGSTVYSDPLLNVDGLDWFGTFPVLAAGVPPGTYSPILFNIADNTVDRAPAPLYIAAVANVDEPSTVLMLSLGGLLLARFARRRSISG